MERTESVNVQKNITGVARWFHDDISPRVHENQSVQLGWVAVTAELRDYIILVTGA